MNSIPLLLSILQADTLTTVLTSSLLAGLISAVVSAFVSIRLKNKEYRNDYYKQIINKRLKVYGYLEKQLVYLRSHMMDDKDQQMYLKIFGKGEEEFIKSTRHQLLALDSSFWLTRDTHTLLADLNKLLTELRIRYDISDEEELRKAGKEYNYALSTLRIELEIALRKDMHELYDVDKFFRARSRHPYHYRSSASAIYEAAAQGNPTQDPYSGFSNTTFFLPTKDR